MDYCKRCVYPANARPGILLDEEGVCSGCRLVESRPSIDWAEREQWLVEILERGLRQWRIEKALKRYAAGEMSFGAAAEQAGVSQSELSRQAYARGLEPPFSAQTLAEELS